MAKMNKTIAKILAEKVSAKTKQAMEIGYDQMIIEIKSAYNAELTELMIARNGIESRISAIEKEIMSKYKKNDVYINFCCSRGEVAPSISAWSNHRISLDEITNKILLEDFFSDGGLDVEEFVTNYAQELVAKFNTQVQ
jgi:hypothetical protein